MAVCIEMRRAVRIRERGRTECMWDKLRDAPDQQMIRQIFFQSDSFCPTIVSKDLTHSISMLLRLNLCRRLCQLGKSVMIKFSVARTAKRILFRFFLALRLTFILNHMTDILYAVFSAPAANLFAECVSDTLCQHIHIHGAHHSSVFSDSETVRQEFVPQHWQHHFPFFAQSC